MAPDGTDIGQRIRAFREMRSLSQRALALKAGVSPSFVSQLENGHSNASIGSLRRLTDALGIGLADLFDPSLRQARSILRAANRPELPMEEGSRKFVISTAPLQNVEIYVAELDPGASTGEELYAHGDSQEFLIVTKGEVVFLLGTERHIMASGDSVEYRSSVGHGLRNESAELAEVIWVTSPPTGPEEPVPLAPS